MSVNPEKVLLDLREKEQDQCGLSYVRGNISNEVAAGAEGSRPCQVQKELWILL